jgi:hypothetical protein
MSARAPLLLLVATLIACGGDSTGIVTPPPPPPVVHAHLVHPSDTSVKASGTVALSALGYKVVDDQGAPLSGYTVALTSAPSTWAHTSSSFTPALDTRGRVSLSVTAPGGAAAEDTGSVQVTAQLDFKRYTWHATWACSFAPGTHTSPTTTMGVDSMYASLAADTTYVLGDQSPIPLNTFGAVVYGTMTYTFFGDSIETTTQAGALPANIPGSVIDTLLYSIPAQPVVVGVRDTTAALPRYVGGEECSSQSGTPISPVVLQAMTDRVVP